MSEQLEKLWPFLNWDSMLSIGSNTATIVVSVIWMVVVVYAFRDYRFMMQDSAKIGLALVFLGLLMLIRMGYWSPTMWLAYPAYEQANECGMIDRYHPWWIQHREWSYLLQFPLVVATAWLILGTFVPRLKRYFWIGVVLALVVGVAAAVTWQASEFGLWFDRMEIILWFENLVGYER